MNPKCQPPFTPPARSEPSSPRSAASPINHRCFHSELHSPPNRQRRPLRRLHDRRRPPPRPQQAGADPAGRAQGDLRAEAEHRRHRRRVGPVRGDRLRPGRRRANCAPLAARASGLPSNPDLICRTITLCKDEQKQCTLYGWKAPALAAAAMPPGAHRRGVGGGGGVGSRAQGARRRRRPPARIRPRQGPLLDGGDPARVELARQGLRRQGRHRLPGAARRRRRRLVVQRHRRRRPSAVRGLGAARRPPPRRLGGGSQRAIPPHRQLQPRRLGATRRRRARLSGVQLGDRPPGRQLDGDWRAPPVPVLLDAPRLALPPPPRSQPVQPPRLPERRRQRRALDVDVPPGGQRQLWRRNHHPARARQG